MLEQSLSPRPQSFERADGFCNLAGAGHCTLAGLNEGALRFLQQDFPDWNIRATGGPPAAIVFCYFYLKRKGLPTWRTADIILPYLPLGHAFGRIGCFLNGCCYGLPSSVPKGAVPTAHPPQICSALHCIAVHMTRFA